MAHRLPRPDQVTPPIDPERRPWSADSENERENEHRDEPQETEPPA